MKTLTAALPALACLTLAACRSGSADPDFANEPAPGYANKPQPLRLPLLITVGFALCACGNSSAPEVATGLASGAAAAIRFSAPLQLDTGPSWMVQAADLDGDGRPDIVSVNPLSLGPGGVAIEINTTPKGSDQASFSKCPSLSTDAPSPQALAVADMDGDGKPDIVVGNLLTSSNFPPLIGLPTGPGIQVFLNRTVAGAVCPSFAPPVNITAGTAPEVLVVADFNGDGLPDLAFTDYGIPALAQSQDVSVVLNRGVHNGQLEFSPRFSYSVGNQPLGVVTPDVNGDGRPDLLVSNNFSYSVSVLLNTTPQGADQPSFSAPTDFPAGSAPIGPETLGTGDINGDGRPDIVTPNFLSAHGMTVLLNTTAAGTDSPSFEPTEYGVGLGPQHIAIADFDGDGKNDIALALQGTVAAGNQAVLTGGAVSEPNPLVGNIVTSVSSGVQVFANLAPTGATQPKLAAPIWFAAGNGSDALAVADFNGDRRPDLAVGNNLGGVSVLLNQTPFPH